jgi:hypothetical protein
VVGVTAHLEYRVWHETADLVYAGPCRDDAAAEMTAAIGAHVAQTGCAGCGVLTPPHHHGFSPQIIEDGNDVTSDPSLPARWDLVGPPHTAGARDESFE